MIEQQRDLLKRLFGSRYFASAESLRKILEYLCQRSEDAERGTIKEYDIAVHALGRPSSFDPKTDPIVRVNIATIRERLRSFFEYEASDSPIRLTIPKGQYRVIFEEAPKHEVPVTPEGNPFPALERFWHPYLTQKFPNTLVFTELLFFRDNFGNYVRNDYVNEMQGGLELLAKKLPGLKTEEFRPSFHFISAGEVDCMLKLTRLFAERGVECNARKSRFLAWNSLQNTNLILIGSSRTNPFIDSLQGENLFFLTADRIINRSPRPGEQESYAANRTQDGKSEKVTEYAIVSRCPAPSAECVATCIAGNNGRALQGAGDFLSGESQVSNLLETLEAEQRGAAPSVHFQVLLKVETVDFDAEAANVEIVSTRVIGG